MYFNFFLATCDNGNEVGILRTDEFVREKLLELQECRYVELQNIRHLTFKRILHKDEPQQSIHKVFHVVVNDRKKKYEKSMALPRKVEI